MMELQLHSQEPSEDRLIQHMVRIQECLSCLRYMIQELSVLRLFCYCTFVYSKFSAVISTMPSAIIGGVSFYALWNDFSNRS